MLGRRVERRLVDAFGLVGCGAKGRDVAIEECLACPNLVGVTRGADERVEEIRCTGISGAARSHTAMFGPMGPQG